MANITIQSGDTLSGIAQKQGSTVQDLMKLNPQITDPNRIFAGAQLNIPTAQPSTTPTTPPPTVLDAATLGQGGNVNVPPMTPVDTTDAFVASTLPSQTQADQAFKDSQKTNQEILQSGDALLEPAQTEQSGLLNRIAESFQKLSGKGARQQELEQQAQIPQSTQQLQEINLQIAQRKGEFDKAIAALPGQGRGITTPILAGQEARARRQQAVEIGALTSIGQALQGNIALAQQTVDRTVALEFESVQQEIDQVKYLLDINKDNFTKAESKRVEQVQLELLQRQEALDVLKENRTTVLNYAAEAAKNGADNVTVNSIIKAKTPEEALSLGAEFLAQPEQLQTQVVDVNGRKQLINSQTGETISDLGATDAALKKTNNNNKNDNKTDTRTDGALTDFDILAEAVSNKIGSVTAKKSFQKQFANAKTDDERIKILAANASLPNEIRVGIIQNTQVAKSLDDVLGLLDKGVQTGLLQAGQSYIANKAGTGADKQVEAIKSKLITAVQPYRNKVTGAAWGAQEEAEYQALLGSVKFAPEDLRNKINVFKQTLQQQSQSAILSSIDPLGAINQDSTIQDNSRFVTNPILEPETAAPATKGFFSKVKNWLFG